MRKSLTQWKLSANAAGSYWILLFTRVTMHELLIAVLSLAHHKLKTPAKRGG
jgi:hypothetical protein